MVIAPALTTALGGLHTKLDYTAFVSIGTVGLLVPLTTVFAGLSVIIDRDSGAQRELLAAPIPRALLVLGNLAVALVLSALQIAVLVGCRDAARRRLPRQRDRHRVVRRRRARLRGPHVRHRRDAWPAASPTRRSTSARRPVVAILPWFFAGALFPISALPGALTAFAKVLPLTHAMALMRYGLVDPHGTGLHDIWGMSNTTTEAWLSLAVVVLFAAALIALAVRSFTRAALR